MSELSECNFCHLQRIKKSAKKRKKTIVLIKEDGWINVYKHPKNLEVNLEKQENKDKYWLVSFAAIGDKCGC